MKRQPRERPGLALIHRLRGSDAFALEAKLRAKMLPLGMPGQGGWKWQVSHSKTVARLINAQVRRHDLKVD